MTTNGERWVRDFLQTPDPDDRAFLICILADLVSGEALEVKKLMFFSLLELLRQASESETESIAFAMKCLLPALHDDPEVVEQFTDCAEELEFSLFRAHTARLRRSLDALSRSMRGERTELLVMA